ncbi:MAG TPA: cysteine synthase family protein [Fimbriimonadaceae bacterium]|nr:cysteine synthase family protein [Fimbriimonadaceae bacterium]
MQGIGNTPLLKLQYLTGPDDAEVWVKWEGANPTGSMKDHMALAMIEGAEARGELKPGGRVVDYTGGSTGSSVAMVCAAKGYRVRFVTSDAFAESKLRTMRAFGAELEIFPSENRMITAELMADMLARVRELAAEPDTFWTDQFNNPDNRNAYHAMGEEIVRQLGGAPDAFVMGVGTGGSFSGNAEVLSPLGTKCVAIEPANSRALSNARLASPPHPLGGHRLEGMGPGFVPSITRLDLADEIVPVSDEDAYQTARDLARKEGIFGGISSGANVWTALRQAHALGRGHRVVTIVVDSGLKYLDGGLYR